MRWRTGGTCIPACAAGVVPDGRRDVRGHVARSRFAVALLAGALALPATGCGPTGGTPQGDERAVAAGELATGAAAGTALAALGDLEVKGRAPRTGYDRDQFGPSWADADRNGCDTRNDVLRRDLTGESFKAGTGGCVVLTGVLADPYTGRTITFQQGPGTSDAVQVDHVVALSDAWQKGAQQWDLQRRTAFANDPLNLLAVDGPTNTAKGDGDAATWLPPDRSSRCAYVTRQVAVKARYDLWLTAAERDAVAGVLSSCPDQALPREADVAAPPRSATAAEPDVGQAPAGAGPDPRFSTCSAAVATGYGPYRAGADPEYAWYRDADGDGRVCER